MRKLSLTLLAAGAVLTGAAPHAHAQFFNVLTQFQMPNGTPPSGGNIFSTDGLSALGENGVSLKGIFVPPSTVTVPLYTFATNSQVGTTGAGGTFNYPYRVMVTLTPSDSSGAPLAGYSALTQYVTGTITGQLTANVNTLTNTYDNLVSTPSGQAEVFSYIFASAGVPTLNIQLRTLASGFNNGDVPPPTSKTGQTGGATSVIVSTPEPGTLALFFGMGLSGAMVARRRMRRK